MKLLTLVAVLLAGTSFAFQAFDGKKDLKIFNQIKCDEGIKCSREKEMLKINTTDASASKETHISSWALNTVHLSKKDCGKTFTRIVATAATVTLDKATNMDTNCKITFMNANAANTVKIEPDSADQIVPTTNSAGDSVTASTMGTLVIKRIGDLWVVQSLVGTWADTD